MIKPNLQKPSKVERARVRLRNAVARLENAVESSADPGQAAKELVDLRSENAELKTLTVNMSQRLDSAIGRLRAAIGE